MSSEVERAREIAARYYEHDPLVSEGRDIATLIRNGMLDDQEAVRVALLAIAAERERCAKIAEMHDHRGDIAAAIRSDRG